MPFDISDVFISHGTPGHKKLRRQADCANGGFYRSPTAGQTIPSTSKLTISWDTSCLNPAPKQVDIHLLAPYTGTPEIFTWTKVDYRTGKLDVDLLPQSWNKTTTVSLQLNIIESDLPLFLSTIPPGPVFKATYDPATAPTGGNSGPSADPSAPFTPYMTVGNSYKPGGLTKGGLAAAVLFPLLAVFAAVFVYVKWTRAKEAKKRQRWSQAVDKRMSTISGDWKSISAAGASAAIRHSMAPSNRNTRASSFFAGNGPYAGRPSSTFANEGNQAGVGSHEGEEEPDMSQVRRPRASTLASANARVSRVSFAADLPRPSMGGESLRQSVYSTPGIPSRAFHRSGDESPPPLPRHSIYHEESPVSPHNPSYNLSPTQTQGPQSLTPDVIRSRIANGKLGEVNDRPSMDGEFRSEVLQMPAMTMMRTGGQGSDDYLIPSPMTTTQLNGYPSLPNTSVPVPPLPLSNENGNKSAQSSGMMPLSDASTTLSPDAMLRAYAAKRATKGPAALGAPQQMRTLYSPTESVASDAYSSDVYSTHVSSSVGVGPRNPNRLTVDVGTNNPYRSSMVHSALYSDTSRYSTMKPRGQQDIGEAA